MIEHMHELLPQPILATGLCAACGGDAALPDGEFCASCAEELKGSFAGIVTEIVEERADA